MLFASRIASNFSSWDVASVERREENSTVFVRLGLNVAVLDRNLFPYLLGFREGIVAARPRGICRTWSVQPNNSDENKAYLSPR